jgi:outer membrane murein-binding lipoprotein Lpp
MNKPLLKLPQNLDDLNRERKEAEDRLREILRKEFELKIEYTSHGQESEAKIRELNTQIKNLNAQIKMVKSELSRFQRENRSQRRKLAEERLRLTKDLQSLNSRYSGLISRTRKKVSENPEEAFRLMEAQK